MKKMQIIVPEKVSYSKAIREKCLDCCCGQVKEVTLCEVKECPLFPYRFGCGPHTAVKKYGDKIKVIEG